MAFKIKLQPRYNARASFYGKASVRKEGNKLILTSYSTDVAQIEDGKATVFGDYSLTTSRHIKEFLLQNGFKADNTKQIQKDYSEETYKKEIEQGLVKGKAYTEPSKSKEFNIPVMAGERAFKINDRIQIVARYEKARDGFNHFATLYIDGKEVETAKVHYINRTWERYEFQSVMKKLIDKSTSLSPADKQLANSYVNKDNTDWSGFKTTSAIASLGDIFGKTIKEKNDWKERMLKAGLGNKGLEMPDDWDKLDEKTKQKRLDMVIKLAGEVGKK